MASYKLGGRLVGYGIKRNGVEHVFMLDKPIHNTITKSCLDNMLMYNGSSAVPSGSGYYDRDAQSAGSLFISESILTGVPRFGVFQFCALGDGTGATSVDDIDLHNRLTDYSNVAPSNNQSNSWNGSTFDSVNHTFICRRSHTHTIASDITVKEIGWFHRISPSGAYSLSSRVVLDNPISLQSGDTFYTIYEWVISVTPRTEHADWFGMGPVVELGMIGMDTTNHYSVPYVTAAGVGGIPGNFSTNTVIMDTLYGPNTVDSYNPKRYVAGIVTSNIDTENMWGTRVSTYQIPYSYIQSVTTADYTPGSFYREKSFTFAPGFAEGNSIYSWFLNGTVYRFGKWENGTFTPMPLTPSSSDTFRITIRQSWSTDLLTPSA